MAEILHQLRPRVNELPDTLTDATHTTWTFSDQISNKDAAFYNSLAINRPLLAAQYRVQCAQLIVMFRNESTDRHAFLQAAEAALVMAELLEHVYRRLEETEDLNRLHADKARLRIFLSQRYPQFKTTTIPTPNPPAKTLFLRKQVDIWTPRRLLLVRIRRTILATIVLEQFAMCRPGVRAIEYFTNPFFSHVAWVFFIPRLSMNLIFLGKHLIPHPWMSAQERALPWTTRLQTYMDMHRHSFELVNDIGWFLCGVLSCFLCTGAWLPIRAYLAIGMQLGEFVISYLRCSIEINRLKILEKEYHAGCANGTLTFDEKYFEALKNRIEHEYRTYHLEMTRNILLNLSIVTILPLFVAINPLIPIAGALLAVTTSISIILWTSYNSNNRPEDDLVRALQPKGQNKDVASFLSNHSMFKPAVGALPREDNKQPDNTIFENQNATMLQLGG